ncbi:MAG: hypothetical protein HYZ14_02075 [Bacteroidetes bacterium]|nr:hypothetical protein [Bacteroidota bacterium]
MKRLILFLILAVALQTGIAQRYNLGFGWRGGVTNYLGDIGGGGVSRNFVYNMELKDTRWATGPFINWRFHPLYALQGGITYGRLRGEDNESEWRTRKGRNLNFRNDIFEVSAKLEVYPQILSLSDVGYRGRYRVDYQTYFFAGIGAVYHNPKAYLVGGDPKEYYKLRPLMTEGVRYSPLVVTVPFGGGFFFTYKRQHRFGFEFQWSWVFTDYLDDVHDVYVAPSDMASDPMAAVLANQYIEQPGIPGPQNYGNPGNIRGDPTDRDNYMFMTVSYSFLIRTRSGFYRSNYSWMYGRHRKWGGTKAKF